MQPIEASNSEKVVNGSISEDDSHESTKITTSKGCIVLEEDNIEMALISQLR